MPNVPTDTATPVFLVLEDGQSVPVSIVLREKDGVSEPLPVSLQSNEVVLSDSSVSALAQAVSHDAVSGSSADVGLINCCSVLLCVGVFACFGCMCVRFLVDRLSVR